jgi:hypothetical protein
MGFVNISGQTVHTSAIGSPIFGTPSVTSGSLYGTGSSTLIISSTSSNTTITNGTAGSQIVYANGSTLSFAKTTYHVLGEDIQVDSYANAELGIAISTLNILGKPFYDQLKKNNVSFPKEIEEYLEKKFKILERDRKIKEILKS